MKKTNVTYGQLDRVLRALGFSRHLQSGKPPAIRYTHKETGALISVPPFPERDQVMEHHMVTARVMLDEFGIADADDFAGKLQKAKRNGRVVGR